jgi:hypothetical protein
MESTIRAVHIIVLEQTNAAIANRIAEISVRFAQKDAASHGGRTVGHRGA